MNVILYQFNGRKNEINKTLVELEQTEIFLKKELQNVNDISFDVVNVNRDFTANYCYIPQFKRYYFVNNIVIVNNSVMRLNCHVDLLQTYKENILECSATVTETTDNYNNNFATTEKSNDFKSKKIEIETDFINTENNLVLVVEK